MADFFSRLAERTLLQAPVARPFISSRFTPGASCFGGTPTRFERDEAQSAGNDIQALEQETVEFASRAASPAPLQVSEATPSLVTPRPLQHETRNTGPMPGHRPEAYGKGPAGTSRSITQARLRAVPDTQPPLADTSGPSGEQEPHALASRVSKDAWHVSQCLTPHTESVPRHRVKPAPARPVEARPSRKAIDSETPETFGSLPRLAVEERAPNSPLEPRSRRVKNVSESLRAAAPPPEPGLNLEARPDTTSPRKSSAAGVLRPDDAAFREPKQLIPRGQEAALPRPSPAPPTIRVTIGRVEVRTVMPSASSPPRTAPARRGPAVSLDDYLKKRNEGTR